MAQFAGTNLTEYFSKPDFGEIGSQAIEGAMLQRATAEAASISAIMNKDRADTDFYINKNKAKTIKAQGAQQAQGMVQDAWLGAAQSLGGVAIKKFTPSSPSTSTINNYNLDFGLYGSGRAGATVPFRV